MSKLKVFKISDFETQETKFPKVLTFMKSSKIHDFRIPKIYKFKKLRHSLNGYVIIVYKYCFAKKNSFHVYKINNILDK